MTTEAATQLDQQTRDELQPECDAGKTICHCKVCRGTISTAHACSNPATHAVTCRCSQCEYGLTVLCCPSHASETVDAVEGLRHRCGGYAVVRIEPI